MNENSGGDVGYYVVQIDHPKRFKPCVVECEDIIAALGMDFFEGEAFKAVWRKAAQRTLGVGKAGNSALRDAQKMAHYGARCLALEEQRGMPAEKKQGPVTTSHPRAWQVGDIVQFVAHATDYHSTGKQYRLRAVGPGEVRVSNDGTGENSFTPAGAVTNFAWVSRA